MLDRSKLGKVCYEAWRWREDIAHPVVESLTLLNASHRMVNTSRTRPRPKWEHLDSIDQETWRCVADVAGALLSEAMDTL